MSSLSGGKHAMRRIGIIAATTVVAAGLVVGTAPPSGAAETCHGKPATVIDSPGDHQGSAGDDVVVVLAGDYSGLAGDDTICLRGAQLHAAGDEGDDRIQVDSGTGDLYGAEGDDVLLGGPGADEFVTGPGDDLVRAGDGRDLMIGGPGPDRLEAGAGNDLVNGDVIDGVDDELLGGHGRDRLMYWSSDVGIELRVEAGTVTRAGEIDRIAGFEIYAGSGKPDTMYGSGAGEWLLGDTGGPDRIYGYGGDDGLAATRGQIWGGAGDDVLNPEYTGLPSAATVRLGDGADHARVVDGYRPVVRLGNGDDRLTLTRLDTDTDPIEATLEGGLGRNTLVLDCRSSRIDLIARSLACGEYRGGIGGFQEFRGSPGVDRFYGGPQRQTVHGRQGDDLIHGRGGNDTLHGDRGRDRANGGPGRDHCTAERRISC